MPNHIANIVSFDGDAQQISKMLTDIQNDKYGPGTISFNKLDPMPLDLDIELSNKTTTGLRIYREFMDIYSLGHPMSKEEILNVPEEVENKMLHIWPDVDKETLDLGKRAFQNTLKYGAADWHEWCTGHWGTKWDAYGYDENTDYSQCDKLAFMTALSEPSAVILRLSELYPDIEITHQWADEDYGYHCGTAKYQTGEQTELDVMQYSSVSEEFALDIWDQLNTNGTPIEQGQTMQ